MLEFGLDSSVPGLSTVAGSCKQSNKLPTSTKGGKFFCDYVHIETTERDPADGGDDSAYCSTTTCALSTSPHGCDYNLTAI
jgi:hypothetical protein